MLDKKMSAKINYDVLKRLTEQEQAAKNGGGIVSRTKVDTEADDSNEMATIVTVIESGSVVPRRNRIAVKEEPDTSQSSQPSKKKIKTEQISHIDTLMRSESKSILLISKPVSPAAPKVQSDSDEVDEEPEVESVSAETKPQAHHEEEDEHCEFNLLFASFLKIRD